MYETQVKNIAPEEARRLHEEGVPFIDVREVEEYAQARIPGASLLPLSEFMARYGEIPQDRPVVLYCRTGNRSWQAAAWLASLGYDQVLNLDGGIVRWYRSGLPVDTTPVEVGYAATPFQEVGPHEAQALLEEALVVDVREPWEYAEGHLPGAVNIPLSTLPARLCRAPPGPPPPPGLQLGEPLRRGRRLPGGPGLSRGKGLQPGGGHLRLDGLGPPGGAMTLALLGALLIGLSLGLLGSGGSILTVPVLVYLLGEHPKQAIAESLLIVGGIALLGAIPLRLKGPGGAGGTSSSSGFPGWRAPTWGPGSPSSSPGRSSSSPSPWS
jgi:rhodanese-related sulfurtransferase